MIIRRTILRLTIFIVTTAVVRRILSIVRVPATSIAGGTEGDCPLCYGDDFCRTLPSFSVGLIDYWFNYRNVYFATSSKNERIALKNLATNRELAAVREALAKLSGISVTSNPSAVGQALERRFHSGDLSSESILDVRPDQHAPNAIASCPTADLLKDLPFSAVSSSVIAFTNPEPIVLSKFPRSSGWPFPKFLGSCGLVVAEEYVGPSLDSLFGESWEKRAGWAIQLLEIAETLSNKSPTHVVYLTDLDLNNFAVDPETNELLVVDAEHVIVVNRVSARLAANRSNPLINPNKVDDPLIVEHVPCGRHCLSFVVDELCAHSWSDHNYYAVCRALETNEQLLAGVPDAVVRNYWVGGKGGGGIRREIDGLVAGCVEGRDGKSRVTWAEELKAFLKKVLSFV